MKRNVGLRRAAAWSAVGLLGILGTVACVADDAGSREATRAKPKPEVFDQEVVTVTVDYERGKISVEPESVRIYFQWSSGKQDPLMPVQARWVVKGLNRDHVLHIVPKKDAPEVRFPFPNEYQGRPAYSIPGRHNSIVSGRVRQIPGLVEEKGYTEPRRQGYDGGEPYEVVWPYDVIVAERSGEELFRVDPQIVVAGHP